MSVEETRRRRRRSYDANVLAEAALKWGRETGRVNRYSSVNGLACQILGAWRMLRHPEEGRPPRGWCRYADYSARETALAYIVILCLMVLRAIGTKDVRLLIARLMGHLKKTAAGKRDGAAGGNGKSP